MSSRSTYVLSAHVNSQGPSAWRAWPLNSCSRPLCSNFRSESAITMTRVNSTSLGILQKSMLIRYISNIRMNFTTKASRWKMTLVPVLIRCS